MTDFKAVYAQRQMDLARSSCDPRDKEAITRFLNSLQAQGIGESRLSKYLGHFAQLRKLLPRALVDVKPEELDRLLAQINTSRWAAWTKRDYQVTLKKFYRFFDGTAERAGRVRVIRPSLKQIEEKEVLNEEDVRKMEAACRNNREQTVVRMLFESAGACKEFLDLRVGDAADKPPFIVLHFHGTKTVYRNGKVPIDNPRAIDLFRSYMESHPRRDNPRAPLWLNYHGEPMEPRNFAKFLKGLAKRAGIEKRFNPHWFRHSKITQLRSVGLSDAAIRIYARWSKSSNMLAVYDHTGLNSLMAELESKRPQSDEERAEQIRDQLAELIQNDSELMAKIVEALFKTGKISLLKNYSKIKGKVGRSNFPYQAPDEDRTRDPLFTKQVLYR